MQKTKNFVVVCVILFCFVNVKVSDGRESVPSASKGVNVIIVIDTSDRISQEKHPGQVERDIEIITEIVTQFGELVKAHLAVSEVIQYPHRLTFVIPNQPKVPPIPWQLVEKLTIEDSRKGRSYPEFVEQKDTVLRTIPELYNYVKQYQQTGSNIWEWFKYEAEDYFSKDHQNLIICLSDGYLNFDRDIEARLSERTYMRVSKLRNDPNWKQKIQGNEGLLPIENDLGSYNVKFLMAEVALHRERGSGIPYLQDFEIIKTYWTTWLNTMGIKDPDFIKQGRPLKRKIRALISVEGKS